MLYVLFALLGFWLFSNLIVLIKYKPKEMWQDLVLEQNLVGRVCGNLFYSPYWLIMIAVSLFNHYVIKNIVKFIRFCYFAIARFVQQIYHSIFDVL